MAILIPFGIFMLLVWGLIHEDMYLRRLGVDPAHAPAKLKKSWQTRVLIMKILMTALALTVVVPMVFNKPEWIIFPNLRPQPVKTQAP